MNRERLFKHLEDHYIPKREMISRIPLGVQPDEFWQDVLNRRRSRSISLQLHNPRGIPYWYVVTNKMITASEQVVTEMLENETGIRRLLLRWRRASSPAMWKAPRYPCRLPWSFYRGNGNRRNRRNR